MPSSLLPWRRLSASQQIMAAEFMRFGMVGVAGFVVDTATVYASRAELGLYGAGLLAYLCAASVTWAFNRIWTFRHRRHQPAHRQWAMFMLVNLGGFVLNRGTYALMVTFSAAAASQPVIAVAAGAGAGMFINFGLSRRLVFR